MSDRTQPVCKGVNKKGELVWGVIPMPYWQMRMFPLKYYGDFFVFWTKLHFFQMTGFESDRDEGSLDLRRRPHHGRKRSQHPGD
jgi:hypothetical protein